MPGMFTNVDLMSSGPVVPGSKPGKPTISVAALNSGATVTITPGSTGNRDTKYVVKQSNGSAVTDVNANTSATTHGVTGLSNGTTYSLVVVAYNEFGYSVASDPVNVTPAVPYVPKMCYGNFSSVFPGTGSNYIGCWPDGGTCWAPNGTPYAYCSDGHWSGGYSGYSPC